MLVTPHKTRKVIAGDDLFVILAESLPSVLPEKSVIAVSSKIIALCEGRVADPKDKTRDELAEEEAELYLPRATNPFDVMVTIKHNTLIASAGIDQSNANGQYVLWPKDPQQSADIIREFLCKQYKRKYIGVIVTDSRLSPLRWGVTGVSIAYSGFVPLNDYVGKPDVFGRLLRVEKVNVADTLAAAAVGVMGEGDEQTPLAVITDASFVSFLDRSPTQAERDALTIDMYHEVFTPLLASVAWKKGKGGK